MIKIFRYLKPYTLMIIVILILVFLQTLCDLYLPTLMSDIIDKGVMQGKSDLIWKTGSFMLLITGAGVLCAIIASLLSAQTAVGFGKNLRSVVFRKAMSFSLHEYDKIGTSTMITRTTNDITQVQMVVIVVTRMMVMAPMMAIGGIIMAWSKDKSLTLVFAIAIPMLILIIILIARKVMPLFQKMQLKIDRINLVLREKLTGIRVIRAFNKEDFEKRRFDAANSDLTENYIKVNKIMAFVMPMMMLIMNLVVIPIYWFGIIRIDAGKMELGALFAFTQYAMQIMFSMLMVSMMFIMVPRALVSAKRISEVLDTDPGITDPANSKQTGKLKGQVEFRDVCFSYHGADKQEASAEQQALAHISFMALPGEVTAIIGSTGSGKTTLVNLIPRFYDTDSGSVLVDGVDVRDMSQEDLRHKIGFIPQKPMLFSGSIADNIRFGYEQANPEEVQKAAEIAQAMEFIKGMDTGFEYEIAQSGTNLSGGQKQRLAIARALARKPEIYIFDDSFSALDFKTDALLRSALKNETREATVLIVAQRVGTVMDADRIIVLDKGTIQGIGKHEELLQTCPVYREIVLSQLSEEEIA